MQTSEKVKLTPVGVLNSGEVYLIEVHHRCYRIHEVDHFRQDRQVRLVAFLDQDENLHHFNTLDSKWSATTPLGELLAIDNLFHAEFCQVSAEDVNELAQHSKDETLLMMKKTLDHFMPQAVKHQGQQWDVQALLQQHAKDYIRSPELRN